MLDFRRLMYSMYFLWLRAAACGSGGAATVAGVVVVGGVVVNVPFDGTFVGPSVEAGVTVVPSDLI